MQPDSESCFGAQLGSSISFNWELFLVSMWVYVVVEAKKSGNICKVRGAKDCARN